MHFTCCSIRTYFIIYSCIKFLKQWKKNLKDLFLVINIDSETLILRFYNFITSVIEEQFIDCYITSSNVIQQLIYLKWTFEKFLSNFIFHDH